MILTPAAIARSVFLFVIAALFEIGGGYLFWLWLRDRRGVAFGVLGGLVLFLYGVIPTLQTGTFARVYAAYGGVFVVFSLLWGWLIDRQRPDRFDVIGSILCLAGVAVMMYAPRK
jgi:small multidrug resistance family-3 protein